MENLLRVMTYIAVCQMCCIPECEKGRWGLACAESCPDCENGGECDKQNGTCVCPPGYTGNLCQDGRSGHSCNLSVPAGHCSHNVYTSDSLYLFMTLQQLYVCTSVIYFYDSVLYFILCSLPKWLVWSWLPVSVPL